MTKKNKPDARGFVYSTDPGFQFEEEKQSNDLLPPARQQLRVILETKQRAGKAVTVVFGFKGPEEVLEELGKKLKSHCGTGGSVKEGEIIVQGDQRDKVIAYLVKNGYTNTKKSGA